MNVKNNFEMAHAINLVNAVEDKMMPPIRKNWKNKWQQLLAKKLIPLVEARDKEFSLNNISMIEHRAILDRNRKTFIEGAKEGDKLWREKVEILAKRTKRYKVQANILAGIVVTLLVLLMIQ